jgi:hypothetical protein
MKASCDHGVLTLRIPVAEKAKPKRIRIDGGNGDGVNDVATPSRSNDGEKTDS